MSNPQAHVSEDLLLDLSLGYVQEDEQEVALQHLSGCARCESSLMGILRRQERARSRGQLDRTSRGIQLETHPPRPRSRPTRLRPVASSIAILAAAASILLMLLAPPTSDLTLSIHPLPDLGPRVHLRADATEHGEALQGGLRAYREGDLQQAIVLLSAPVGEGASELLRRVFLGSAHARAGDPASAVEALEGLPFESIPDPWGSEARWTLGVALRETGRIADAAVLFRDLAIEPGPVGDRAREFVPRL